MSSVAAEDMSSVATEDMSSVATEDMSSVATEDMSSAATEDMSSAATEDDALKRFKEVQMENRFDRQTGKPEKPKKKSTEKVQFRFEPGDLPDNYVFLHV